MWILPPGLSGSCGSKVSILNTKQSINESPMSELAVKSDVKQYWLALPLFSVLVFILSTSPLRAQANSEYRIAAEPDWIKPLALRPSAYPENEELVSGVRYLLSDQQVRVTDSDRLRYRRFAQQAVNQKGIDEIAQVSVTFDPSYEQLILHKIEVLRDGKRLNKLKPKAVKLLQREKELEYRIYDGRKSINVILEDIRTGDIVEYSYTRKGINPIFGGRFFGYQELQWSVPVGQVQYRLLWPKQRKLHIKNHGSNIKPKIKTKGDVSEYRWRAQSVPGLVVDDELPQWYHPYPWLQLSEYQSWKEIVDWALPIYGVPTEIPKALQSQVKKIAASTRNPEERLLKVLGFAQDEIRYMGIEIGTGSYVPSKPAEVLQRRFGDCKDKTMLMVTMLKELGIEASPALVHTDIRRTLAQFHPTPTAFNHVLVRAKLNGSSYWLDPTRSYQKGNLETLYQPDYDLALVLEDGVSTLIPMERKVIASDLKVVEDTFNLTKGVGEPAKYTIKTTYHGIYADYIRSRLAEKSPKELQKEYLNYYARAYPSIATKAKMHVSDHADKNRIIVTEHYSIPELWRPDNKKKNIEAGFYPLDMDEAIKAPTSPLRTMPLYLGHQMEIRQVTKVLLPEEWPVEPEKMKIEDPAFSFEREVAYRKKVLTLSYGFKMLTDHIEAKATKSYVEKLKRADNALGYIVYEEISHAAGQSSADDALAQIK